LGLECPKRYRLSKRIVIDYIGLPWLPAFVSRLSDMGQLANYSFFRPETGLLSFLFHIPGLRETGFFPFVSRFIFEFFKVSGSKSRIFHPAFGGGKQLNRFWSAKKMMVQRPGI